MTDLPLALPDLCEEYRLQSHRHSDTAAQVSAYAVGLRRHIEAQDATITAQNARIAELEARLAAFAPQE